MSDADDDALGPVPLARLRGVPVQPVPAVQIADMASDTEEDDDDNDEDMADHAGAERAREAGPARVLGRGRDHLPLHHFLRLIGAARMPERPPVNSYAELLQTLRASQVLRSDAVQRAMGLCPRDHFVTEAYREEAFVDAPIRLDELDFNVSAPHMHATCLEHLDLKPGHKFLDVGSGCGILTACGAALVGKGGAAVGVDIRPSALELSRLNVERLSQRSAEYAGQACDVMFHLHNVFIPHAKHKGQYDRVHVGASCPADRLGALLALLKPSGGVIVTPVDPADLRMIAVAADGTITQRTLSTVRYSRLDVPSDADIMLGTLRMERRQRMKLAAPPSTFAQDVANITGSGSGMLVGSLGSSCGSDRTLWRGNSGGGRPRSGGMGLSLGGSPCSPGGGLGAGSRGGSGSPTGSSSSSGSGSFSAGSPSAWPRRVAKFLAACSPGGASSSGSMSVDEEWGEHAAVLDAAELGPQDCTLVGPGWACPLHRAVLRARCEHFRARCDSGMRDADDRELAVPEHFSHEAVQAFVRYLYTDGIDRGLEPQGAVALLHVAAYYGAPRLVALCELALARELRRGSAADPATQEAAIQLLQLADEAGLQKLLAVAVDFLVQNWGAAAALPCFGQLSPRQVSHIAREACARLDRTARLMREVAAHSTPLPLAKS